MNKDDRRRRPLCAGDRFTHFEDALKGAVSETKTATSSPTSQEGDGSGTPNPEVFRPASAPVTYRCVHCGHLPHAGDKDCGAIDGAGDECDCISYAADLQRPVDPPTLYMLPGVSPRGLVDRGNINLLDRPIVKNADGTWSSLLTTGFGVNTCFHGWKQVLVPRVSDDGRILSEDEAIEYYWKNGRSLASFDSIEHGDAYAQALHDAYEQGKIPGYARGGILPKRVLIVGDRGLATFAALTLAAGGYNANIQMAQADEDRLRIQSDRRLIGQVHDEVLMENCETQTVKPSLGRQLTDLSNGEVEELTSFLRSGKMTAKELTEMFRLKGVWIVESFKRKLGLTKIMAGSRRGGKLAQARNLDEELREAEARLEELKARKAARAIHFEWAGDSNLVFHGTEIPAEGYEGIVIIRGVGPEFRRAGGFAQLLAWYLREFPEATVDATPAVDRRAVLSERV